MTRPKPTHPVFWKYEELDVRDDVSLEMPEGWKVRVFKVISGDSGQEYFVQLMWSPPLPGGTQLKPICLCNCQQGYFQLPLAILRIKTPCKHADNLTSWLEERKK